MVNVKKKKRIILFFVILLTVNIFTSCSTKKEQNFKVEAKKIPITPQSAESSKIENDINSFIAPYKQHIDTDLNATLCIATETFDKKNGKWESTIGNLMAEATLELGNKVYNEQENKTVDFCILNHGGIRSIIPKGNVSTRTAYEVMPFENKLYVVTISGNAVLDLANYILKEKKPHPLAGIKIKTKNNAIHLVEINNEPLDINKEYRVATTDYLANGGDSMNFLKNSNKKYDTNYKIRSLLIDYFKKVDTLPVIKTQRIIEL